VTTFFADFTSDSVTAAGTESEETREDTLPSVEKGSP